MTEKAGITAGHAVTRKIFKIPFSTHFALDSVERGGCSTYVEIRVKNCWVKEVSCTFLAFDWVVFTFAGLVVSEKWFGALF